MLRRQTRSTQTYTLFPYTTLVRALGVVDEQRQLGEIAAGLEELVELVVVDVAAPHGVRAHAGALGDDARGELLRRHLQGEEGDRLALLDRIALGILLDAGCRRHVVGDVCGQRRLAHGSPGREDKEIRAVPASQQLVEIV